MYTSLFKGLLQYTNITKHFPMYICFHERRYNRVLLYAMRGDAGLGKDILNTSTTKKQHQDQSEIVFIIAK